MDGIAETVERAANEARRETASIGLRVGLNDDSRVGDEAERRADRRGKNE